MRVRCGSVIHEGTEDCTRKNCALVTSRRPICEPHGATVRYHEAGAPRKRESRAALATRTRLDGMDAVTTLSPEKGFRDSEFQHRRIRRRARLECDGEKTDERGGNGGEEILHETRNVSRLPSEEKNGYRFKVWRSCRPHTK